jgi:hypothetical protein
VAGNAADKANRTLTEISRRGLGACQAEWTLVCGTDNLLKLWRHTRRQPAPATTAA